MDKYEITYGVLGQRRRADRRRQSELDRFLWHPPAAADKRRQSADRRSPGTTTAPSTRPRSSRPSAALENYQTDTAANTLGALVAGGANGVTINTPNGPLAGVVRIIAPSTTNRARPELDAVSKLRRLPELSPDERDLGHDRGSERTILANGGPFQNYNLSAVISNSTQTINGMVYPARSCAQRPRDERERRHNRH